MALYPMGHFSYWRPRGLPLEKRGPVEYHRLEIYNASGMEHNTQEYLIQLGWDSFFEEQYEIQKIPGSIPARVSSESKDLYQVLSRQGELTAKLSGRMRYTSRETNILPAVGDWVVFKPLAGEENGIIHSILPRKSKFSRKAAGSLAEEQVISANVDTVFIVNGLDGGRNFNLRRIERYLILAQSSGAAPVIVLNKIDACPDSDAQVRGVESVTKGVPVLAVSARECTGLDALKRYLAEGKTVAFLGSSGAGKSTLINALLGEDRQDTGKVRENDSMGRHTTTRRELILLPGGGVVIDTPGMREIQLWAVEDDLKNTFGDIENLANECRFKDCSHIKESGCAVKAAVDRGGLDISRLESYRKLQKEIVYLAAREEQGSRVIEKGKFKKIALASKQLPKKKRDTL